MTIFDAPDAALSGRYPHEPARLRHRLLDDPRFTLEALVGLAARIPAASIEYNAGDIPIDQDADKTPSNGLSVEETIRRIETCRSWMVLKNVEQDPAYAAALEECLADIAPSATPATGRMEKKLGFIFISSAGAVTPFHMDPEHNILMQIRGSKSFSVYPADKGIVSDEDQELYHAGLHHRNLAHRPEFDALRQTHELKAGDALYVPVKAPHWVKVGPEPSVSFSITWRSRASLDEAALRLANRALRARGLNPPSPGERPLRDRVATLAQRVLSKFA
ncbi:MAG: cupin-like domain-containing protein [Parvularculaceae bacterium]